MKNTLHKKMAGYKALLLAAFLLLSTLTPQLVAGGAK